MRAAITAFPMPPLSSASRGGRAGGRGRRLQQQQQQQQAHLEPPVVQQQQHYAYDNEHQHREEQQQENLQHEQFQQQGASDVLFFNGGGSQEQQQQQQQQEMPQQDPQDLNPFFRHQQDLQEEAFPAAAMPTLDEHELAGVIKLQARMRSWCGRRDAWRERTRQAKLAGVMIAVRGTVQGKTGWYCDYDGHCFFFNVAQAGWTHMADPPFACPASLF